MTTTLSSFAAMVEKYHVELPSFFLCNSPHLTSQYRKFVAEVRDRGGTDAGEGDPDEEDHPEEIQDRFHNWIITMFDPIFSTVAPNVPLSFDPEMIRTGEAKPLLSIQVSFPETHRCRQELEK